MKKLIPLLLNCTLLAVPAAFAQVTSGGPPPQRTLSVGETPAQKPPELQFDLDFPGGTPGELVKAIEKSTGKPLNVIIPKELALEDLPALRMKSVTANELFNALQQSSVKILRHNARGARFGGGFPGQAEYSSSYGFRTYGTPEYGSVWVFFKEFPDDPATEPRLCRFYNLGPYLDTYKVEDVTTAVKTGWQLLTESSPEWKKQRGTQIVMTYHKDTRLLIVVGDESQLKLVESVLKELSAGKPVANSGGVSVATPPEPEKK